MNKLLLLVFISLTSLFSFSQAGSIDITFGTNGVVRTALGEARAMAIQPDGKIVVAGSNFNGTNYDFALVRYNTDGILDNTFGTGGKVTTAIGAFSEFAYAVSIQADGKIVVAGGSFNGTNNDFALARYNANGILDNTFGTGGIVTTAVGTGDDIAYAVAIQTDGKIVAAGKAFGTNDDFALARYNTDGTLDVTFDNDGKLTTAVTINTNNNTTRQGEDVAYAITIQPDGKIIAAGYTIIYVDQQIGSLTDFALVRYNNNGSLDNTFDSDGKVITSISSDDVAYAIALQIDGKIVVAGKSFVSNNNDQDFALVRYNTNGSLDATFDGDGKLTTPIGTGQDIAYAVAVQTDGKIVAAGTSFVSGTGNDFSVVRYNTNGSLDVTFDGDGKTTVNIGGSDVGYAMKLSGNRIYVTGSINTSGTNDIAVAAFLQNANPAPPAIISFTPANGPVGTTVTITGTNFNALPANNIVYFGAVKATVLSGSTTSLTVTLPAGSTFYPISVLDKATGLTGYSSKPFITTFTNPFGSGIPSNYYKPKIDFATNNAPLSVAIGDLDGDGKSDMVVGNSTGVSVYRNISATGNIDASSFAPKVDFSVTNGGLQVAINDMDGDGKLDIVLLGGGVLRNTSTPGNIDASSLAAPVYFPVSVEPGAGARTKWSLAVGDVDTDGKPDILFTSVNTTYDVQIVPNTSAPGSISFAGPVVFSTAAGSVSVKIGDIDGDGKPELVVATINDNVVVRRNTSTPGIIDASSFAGAVSFAIGGAGPLTITIGDLDGDGKQDLVVANAFDYVSVLRNTSTLGSINASSFAGKVDFITGFTSGGTRSTNPRAVAIGDLDGDGKPDIAVTNYSSSSVTVLRNTSAAGTIDASSFAPKADFTTGTNPRSVAIGDLDGDGIPEIATTNVTANTVSILQRIYNTTTTLSSSVNPSTFGQSVTFTATVTTASGTPTGTVTFFDGATSLGTGTLSGNIATFTTSTLTTGSHSITANYAGNASYAASTSPVLTQVVNAAPPASTTTTITSSLNPSIFGQGVTFSVVVKTGNGTPVTSGIVTFYDGAAFLGTGDLSGFDSIHHFTTALTVGSHNITATYGGNSSYAASTSSVLIQVVNAPPPTTTTTTITSSLNPSTFGQSVIFTAKITTSTGTPTGSVTFFDGTTNIGTGTLSGNTATFTTSALTTGSHNITANYAGNANHAASTSSVLIQVVNAPPPTTTTTTITSSLNPSTFGQSVTFTATVTTSTGTPTGTLTFFDGATSLGTGTLSGNTATFTTSALTTGTHNIIAVYTATATHSSSTSAVLVQVVNAAPPATTTTTLTSSNNPSTAGQSVTFTATVTTSTGTPTGTVTFFDGATSIGTGTLSGNTAMFTTSALTTGSHNITAVYTATATHSSSTSAVLIQIVTQIQIGSAKRLQIYPNPVTNGIIYLQMIGMPMGNYFVRLLNSLGQIVITKQIKVSGNSTENLLLGQRVSGVYILELTTPENIMSSHIIIIY